MAIALSDQDVRWLRLRAQRLHPKSAQLPQSVDEVVRSLCGVQAQDRRSATLAVRPRSRDLVAADVEHARVRERSIVRTWCMRGTLHLVATSDVPWLLDLHGPVFAAAGRRRRAELGLDEESSTNGTRAIREILSGGEPRTRAEIASALKPRGVPTEGQATYHLLRLAALEQTICFGPDLEGEPTHVLLDEWVRPGQPATPKHPEAELARRYLAAHGPVAPDDLAAWSGLRKACIRAAWNQIKDELIEITVGTWTGWMLGSLRAWLDELPVGQPAVHLLPAYDSYLLGYRSREFAVPARHAKRVHPGGGLLRPVMIVDGVARATWRTRRMPDRLVVVVEPFEKLSSGARSALEAERTDLARFLEVPVDLTVVAET